MKKFNILHFLWDWRHLPFNIQTWLFYTATRALEVMTIIVMVALITTFVAVPSVIDTLPMYQHFKMIPPPVWVISMTATVVGLVLTMVRTCYVSQMINGWLLIFSGLIFLLVGIAYMLAYPPFTPGMILYPMLAVMCTLAGNNKMSMLRNGGIV